MSRDDAQSRIDSIRNSAINTDRNTRTALNNAVRYNAMLQLYQDRDGRSETRNALAGYDSRTINSDVQTNALEESIRDITEQFNTAVESNDNSVDTPQGRLANRAYRTELGQIVSNETAFNRGRMFEANSRNNLLSHGSAGYAFNSYTSSFMEGSDDAFGSRVLYDNVFGDFENGDVSLSQRAQTIDSEDYSATATQKVLQTLVNKNIADSRHTLDKVDREFERFFGQSAVDEASQSGGGLVRARAVLNRSIERSLELQQQNLNTQLQVDADPNNRYFTQRLKEINQEIVEERLDQQVALDALKQSYGVRQTNDTTGSRIINKAGVREFVDLFNSADSEITIQTYQLQNQTIGTNIRDVVRRRVIEKAIGGDSKGFQLNLVLAYPKQRQNNGGDTVDDRYNLGITGYAINGPNLIEALTMKQFEEDLIQELQDLGYAKEDAKKLINVNVEFRDRKFHPKVYLTDTMAAIGTQNLTAPVGNSINQAGSNFEQMYIARNFITSDEELDKAINRPQSSIKSEKSLQGQIRSSLLYRQIKQASTFEREFIANQTNGRKLPAMNFGGRELGSNYNVGFAGDIYKHLTDTIDYAYQNAYTIVNGATTASGGKKVVGNHDLSMFMILDGAFMLQLGDIAFNEKALIGEMGNEVTKTFSEKDRAVNKYRSYQNKLFDLLITNNANVVVDKKNYKEAVYDPIAEKIEKSNSKKLKQNFAKFGKNLGLMAGNNIFGSNQEYMDKYLQSLGFTDEAGFAASDRKQLMGMGSGNIRMAKTPRQHAKSFGLVQYNEQGLNPELISYYQGSSNMGFYSLDAADKTNTEMGVMFGKGDQLSRVKNSMYISGYAKEQDIEMAREAAERALISGQQMHDFSLTEEQETNELMHIQDRFFQTYNQLSSNTVENRYIDNVRNAPMWQSNVNSGALQVQKARLEDLKANLGLSDTAFKIVERLGEDGGVKSLNVTINMASVLGSDEYSNSTTSGKKLTFELSVLNGPSDRGIINKNSSVDPRNGSSNNPGMVYFVDKNKLIGNGIFVNDSGESIELMGRKQYSDQFQFGTKEGTVKVATGETAYMSSIDITTQIFGQMIGEAVAQKAIQDPAARYDRIRKQGREDKLLTDYLGVMLRGKASHVGKTHNEDLDVVDLIRTMHSQEFELLAGEIMTKVDSEKGSTAKVRSMYSSTAKELNAVTKEEALMKFINTYTIALNDKDINLFGNNPDSYNQRTNLITSLNPEDILIGNREVAKEFLQEYLLPHFRKVVETSPELMNEVLKYGTTNIYQSIEDANFAAKQNTYFEPFLQSVEDTTYGGQQGYYRTLMYGLSSQTDRHTAEIMNDYDDKAGLHQARKYSRITALGYTPGTDIHEFLYRSIASGASSTSKTDTALNSSLLQQQGRQVGSAQNFDVLQSIGIGTKVDRATYVTGFGDDLKISGEFKQSLIDQGFKEDDAAFINIENRLKEDYKSQQRQFMSISSIDEAGELKYKANQNMIFFTGNAKKISQLPQRIKNALGSRPLFQYGVEAQIALTNAANPTDSYNSKTKTINDITKEYVDTQGKAINNRLDKEVDQLKDILNSAPLDSEASNKASERLQLISMFKQDMQVKKITSSKGEVTYEAGELFKLSAIYTGRIKSILSQDQAAYVAQVRKDIEEIFKKEEEFESQEEKEFRQELIRTYVLRASLDNSGLGKMITGNDRSKYNIALLQMSGTYTDTFLANPLLGNVYNTAKDYLDLKMSGADLGDLHTAGSLEGVKVVAQREGYMVTQQLSTKSSMHAEQEDLKSGNNIDEAERMLMRQNDLIAEDDQGMFVHKRDGTVVQAGGEKRTFKTMRGEVDNTKFGVSSSIATKSTSAYGRKGEFSIDYIFSSMERDGNFANNEYLQELVRLRSIVAAGGRRIEGTDSSALVKGVSNFAGLYKTSYRNDKGERVTMNTFQYLESQIEENYLQGQVGGTLASMLKDENRQYVFNTEQGYTPLSSMISGVYNANNFKSFVWSHGATILKERGEGTTGTVKDNFMLNELLGVGKPISSDEKLALARKAASGLLISFGSSYLQGGKDDKFQKAVITGLKQGAAGKAYQKLIGIMQIVNQADIQQAKRKGISTEEYLFDELVKKEKASKGLYFNDANLAGLRGLNADDIALVMSGDPNDSKTIEATNRFMSQLEGMIVTQAKKIGGQGYMEMSSFSQRQAALMVTAIDMLHQISAQDTGYHLPTDLDSGSEKLKQVLTSVLGGKEFTTPSEEGGLMDEAFQMIQGLNEHTNMVALYADIAYSQSKDPVGTQTVGRHEAQHLMMPFLGDLNAFTKGGQMGGMQHTFASLMALSQGTNSIAAYNALERSGFKNRKAWNMSTVNDEQRLLMSSFTQEQFLGFYRSNFEDKNKSIELKRQFKEINEMMATGVYHSLKEAAPNFKTTEESQEYFENRKARLQRIDEDITNYIEDLYRFNGGTVDNRIKQRRIAEIRAQVLGPDGNTLDLAGATEFLIMRQDLVVQELDRLNNNYNANIDKALGSDATAQFIESMNNKEMFFELPELSFRSQDGMALATSQGAITTFLPSASMMQKLGVQHSDFIDPLIGVYKELAELFVPGSVANKALTKIMAAQEERGSGATAVLTSVEAETLQRVMNAATRMPVEARKAIQGARAQEAFASKTKYSGFTSTGISSFIVPFDAVALSTAKLAEAGFTRNDRKTKAIQTIVDAKVSIRSTRDTEGLDRFYTLLNTERLNNQIENDIRFNSSRRDRAQETIDYNSTKEIETIMVKGKKRTSVIDYADKASLESARLRRRRLKKKRSLLQEEKSRTTIESPVEQISKPLDLSASKTTKQEVSDSPIQVSTTGVPTKKLTTELFSSIEPLEKYIENLIPGKSLEYTEVVEELQGRVKKYYDLQMQAIVQGVSGDLLNYYKEQVVAQKLHLDTTNIMFQKLDAGQGKLEDYTDTILSLYKTRDQIRRTIDENKSTPGSDRFIYETALLNIESQITDLEIRTNRTLGSDGITFSSLTKDQLTNRQTQLEVFRNVTTVLNTVDSTGQKAFDMLGDDTSGLKPYELFDSKYNPASSSSVQRIVKDSDIYTQIMSLNEDIGDKKLLMKSQKELAMNYLNQLESQYSKMLDELRSFSAERNDSGMNEVDQKAKEEAAYSEMLKAHQSIMDSIQSAKTEVESGSFSEKGGIDRVFTSLNTSLIIHDQLNVHYSETFRSPPPGSTDPRIHSYRIMNGVTALNRMASLVKGSAGFSESRNQTATYITAIGTITYGGGDFDGDPYTTILHERENTARSIMNTRLSIDKNETLVRNLKSEKLSASMSPDELAEKERRIKELEADTITKKEELSSLEGTFDKQLKIGYEQFNKRARRQASEYLGVDVRMLVKEGEDTGEVDFKTGQAILGVGSKTYDADSVFTLMNTGHGLVDGLDQKGGDLMAIYDTMNKAFGIRENAFKALNEIKNASKLLAGLKEKNDGGVPESAQGEVLKILRNAVNNTSLLTENSDRGYIGTILQNYDADAARSILEMFSGIEEEEVKFHADRQFAEGVGVEEQSQELLHRFIGGALLSQIQANETYQGFMKKGAGMQISEGGMDVLLKTLGTAGGEILGKTYNTIIGTTFKDSSLIAFAGAVLDPTKERGDNALYKAIEQDFIDRAELGEGTVDEKGRVNRGRASASKYFANLQSALDQARGTQGFMKNIHQLLRDSIKLKSDNDMIGELQKVATTYQNISEQLRVHDLTKRDSADYRKDRDKLVLERDAAIRSISSGLGDGPGLKALMDLDYLINQSKKVDADGKTGLSAAQFSYNFMEGASLQSPEFDSLVDRYHAEIEEQYRQTIGEVQEDGMKRSRLERSRIDPDGLARLKQSDRFNEGLSSDLMKVAQYKVQNQLINLVTGYRMSTSLDLKAGVLTQQADDYLKLTGRSDVDIMADYQTPANPLDIQDDAAKAAKLRKIEALSSYLSMDNSSLYKGNAAQYDKELEEAILKKAGSELGDTPEERKRNFLLTFDARYAESRRQASSLFGQVGEGLATFTNLEGVRSDMANMFKTGDASKDKRIDGLLGVMDAEALQMATQLIGSDKLMTSGFDAFSKLFEGILSNVMVDEVDKAGATIIQQARAEGAIGTDEEILAQPEIRKQVEKAKQAVVTKKSIQLLVGGGEGDRSTSIEGSRVRGMSAQLLENERVQQEYLEATRGSLSTQQAQAMSQLAEHMLLKSSGSEDEFNKMLDAIGMSNQLTKDQAISRRQELKSRLKEQQDIKFKKAIAQQYADKRKMADSDPYLRRGSMLSKLSDTVIGSMATNAGSTVLDILAPIAITAIGGAVSEGAVDATTMQELTGATIQATMFARTGFVDGPQKTYARKMGMAKAVTSVFKFRSALNRFEGMDMSEGEKVARAAGDMFIREAVSIGINKVFAPAISQQIASSLGNNRSIAQDMLTGKKHQAIQQISGNIGSSLISAAASTLISGIILKTTVPNPEKNLSADLQEFEMNLATVNSVSQQIAKARAQEAATQDFETADNGGEPEISSYMVVSNSSYGADSYSDSIALYDPQELDMGNDGGISFDV